jgi:hypothetical protein
MSRLALRALMAVSIALVERRLQRALTKRAAD